MIRLPFRHRCSTSHSPGKQNQIVAVSADTVQILDADHRGGLGTELHGIRAAQLPRLYATLA